MEKKELQTAADGHSNLQVEAGGKGLTEALQVGHADSLLRENTKGTWATALFRARSRWASSNNPSAAKVSAGSPFFAYTSGVNILPSAPPHHPRSLVQLQG